MTYANKITPNKLKSQNLTMFVLLCDCCDKDEPLICGIFTSFKDAKDFNKDEDLRSCPARHSIKKAKVGISFMN